jgi:hypothetical protein
LSPFSEREIFAKEKVLERDTERERAREERKEGKRNKER